MEFPKRWQNLTVKWVTQSNHFPSVTYSAFSEWNNNAVGLT